MGKQKNKKITVEKKKNRIEENGIDGSSIDEQKQNLLRELHTYSRNGCGVFLNGIPAGPELIAETCLREDVCYMRDIVGDEYERIQKINFIEIKERSF